MNTLDSQEPNPPGGELKGSSFKTGLLVGGAPTFVFMFIAGIITIPTALNIGRSSFFPCTMLFIAFIAAYGTNKWVKSFAIRKNLAPTTTLSSGIGGVLGGIAGAVIFSILLVFVLLGLR